MFVIELDRPWIETPFLLQGFLVEDDEQIEQLRKHCRTVVIDRARSVGEHIQSGRLDDTRAAGVMTLDTEEIDDVLPDFANLHTLLNTRLPRHALPKPKVYGKQRQSRMAEELVYSASIVDDVQEKLVSIRSALDEANFKTIELKEASTLVSEMAESVERNADAMIWLTRLRSTDEYSYDHAVDVSVHLMVLGRFMGMPPDRIELLGMIGLMQDVGKVRLPEELLTKRESLTPNERALVKSHIASSMEILSGQTNFSVEALAVVGSHHERFDGSGYPRRIKGERISLFAELAGLIDSYCAMIRRRAYRDAVSNQEALATLNSLRDVHFRAAVVDQLIQCIGLYPVGSLVELNSGEVAVVVKQSQTRRTMPRVMIVLAPDKSVDRHANTIDLMMAPKTPSGDPYHIVRALPLNAYGINPADYYLG